MNLLKKQTKLNLHVNYTRMKEKGRTDKLKNERGVESKATLPCKRPILSWHENLSKKR